jgi:Pectobacterium phage endonuclease
MYKQCEVEGCESHTETLGLRASRNKKTSELRNRYCRKHLTWILKYGVAEPQKFSQASLTERFWRNVDKRDDAECWEWKLSSKSSFGYGSIWDNSQKKSRLVHRVSYEIAYGEIPNDKIVMHSCDNPKCVNPKHLNLGTHKLNGEDKAKKGRSVVNKLFGEQNPKSKLTIERVQFIRAHPEIGHKEIADMWGLSPNCIRGVRIGRTWKEA